MGIGEDAFMAASNPSVHRPRRSASADMALRAEIARVTRMTVEERIKAALALRARATWIQPENSPKKSEHAR